MHTIGQKITAFKKRSPLKEGLFGAFNEEARFQPALAQVVFLEDQVDPGDQAF